MHSAQWLYNEGDPIPYHPPQRRLPQHIVLDLEPGLREFERAITITDPRGYEEVVRQIFDSLQHATPENDLLHRDRVPFVVPTLIRGFPFQAKEEQHQRLQAAFAELYLYIVGHLVAHGFDALVRKQGTFDYVLKRVEGYHRVILTFLHQY